MKKSDPKSETVKRIARTEAYAEKVRQQFAQTVNSILALNKSMPTLDEGVMYSFDAQSVKMQKQVEQLLRQLHSVATMAIQKGITLEWEQANTECDKLIQSCFGKQVLESTEFTAWTQRNEKARDAFMERSDNGLKLSDKIWKNVQQLRDEMEVAMTVAIGEGDSASSMSKKVRQYLNAPDLMFRRFRYKDENGEWRRKWKKRIKDPATGKYKWIDYDRDSYKTGAGVYKSSAKNAMRVARTETNIAYRRADNERWAQMDFVLGQKIQLSKNHPKKDICDKLQGDYPKEFVFDGWHPQCFCFVTPITIPPEETTYLTDIFLKGGDWRAELRRLASGRTITDYPQNFKDWVTEHADQIEASRDRGTEPYFIRNNADVIDEILDPKPKELTTLEKAKLRHEARTPEQIEAIKNQWAERKHKHELIKKTADNVLKVASDYGEVDFSKLQQYITEGNLTAMQSEAKAVAKLISSVKKQEASLSDLIPDAHTWHKTVSMIELQQVYAAVESKLAQWASLSLEQQAKKLKFEAVDFLGGNMKDVQSKFPTTWKISQAAYFKKLAEVEYQIAVNTAKSELSVISTWSANHPKSLKVANLLADAESAINANEDIAIIKQKVALAQAEYQKRLAEQARRDAKKGSIVFASMKPKAIQKLLDKYEVNTVSKMDGQLRPITEAVWATLTNEERMLLTKYTQTYCYLNERLRGLSYSGGRGIDEYNHDMPILTSALNKFKTAKDMVVRRGTGNYYIPELGKDLSMVSVGDEFTEGGFLSTAAHRDKGFGGSINMVIVVPKGARGAFAEPFSHYTDSYKFDFEGQIWDGASVETIEHEFEWIGQRGSRFKVLKVDGSTIYLQMIGQLR